MTRGIMVTCFGLGVWKCKGLRDNTIVDGRKLSRWWLWSRDLDPGNLWTLSLHTSTSPSPVITPVGDHDLVTRLSPPPWPFTMIHGGHYDAIVPAIFHDTIAGTRTCAFITRLQAAPNFVKPWALKTQPQGVGDKYRRSLSCGRGAALIPKVGEIERAWMDAPRSPRNCALMWYRCQEWDRIWI